MKLIAIALFLTGMAFAQDEDNSTILNGLAEVGSTYNLDSKGRIQKKPEALGNFELKSRENYDEASYSAVLQEPLIWKGKKVTTSAKVEREGNKIKRVTESNKYSGEDHQEISIFNNNTTLTYSFSDGDKVNSATKCFVVSDYKLAKSSRCFTVNKKACEYIEGNQILENRLHECSQMLPEFQKYLKKLDELTRNDYEQDIKAISNINGRFSKEKSLYNSNVETLAQLNNVSDGLRHVSTHCLILKNRFAEAEEPNVETTKTKKSWWKKTKNAVKGTANKVNLPFVNDKPKAQEE